MSLAERDRTLTSMQTAALMEYSNGRDHLKAREQIVVRRPAKLRVDAMSPLGLALVVTADGNHLAVFDPSRDTLIRGPATAATLERFAQIPMAPQAAVRLLLGLAPDSSMLTLRPDAVSDHNGLALVAYRKPDGSLDELGFSGGEFALAREKLADGSVIYEIRYRDYRNIGAVTFPYEIDADFPRTGAKLKLRYERPIVDSEVPDSVFVLSPGPAAKLINLSHKEGSAVAPKG